MNLVPVFRALNSTFGKEITNTVVKKGLELHRINKRRQKEMDAKARSHLGKYDMKKVWK